MSATVAIVPTSGNITNTLTTCRVTVAGASSNDDTNFDNTKYPASPQFKYYLLFDNPSGDDGKSYIFDVSNGGEHTFNNYVFPNAGSWTIRLRNAANDSDVATASVTVS